MYNKTEIEKNLRLLEDVINRDFPNVGNETAKENIIRTKILAEFALESLNLLEEDDFLKEVKNKIKDYLIDSKKILEYKEKEFKLNYISV